MRKTICLLIAAVMMMACANAQQPEENNDLPVKFSVKAPDTMAINDTGHIEVVLSFAEQWYGYAETPANIAAGWEPTKVEFEWPDGFEKNGELIIPASVPKGGAEVYKGSVKFVQPVKFTGKDKDGKMNFKKESVLKVIVHYQTCDEEKCLPPVTETTIVKIFIR